MMSFANVPDNAAYALLNGIKGKNLNDEDLLRVHALFGKPTFEAFNLLEEDAVVKATSPSGRFIYKVFAQSIRSNCSHLLAVALSDATNKTRMNTISNQAIAHALEMLFQTF
ncbi:unnamed protein product [Hymenolepis diminuta]|uniref:Myosin motor domain-containing protein n=1 Tax=Hymenolepis diminuta TaxID=6216 RepID=A0A0R3S9J9_HYMDI|nr:unnamed protein product [Hymenolepis diminuta]